MVNDSDCFGREDYRTVKLRHDELIHGCMIP
jgi:hypothetical protein